MRCEGIQNKLIRASVRIFKREYSCYSICGLAGLAISLPFSMVLAAHAGLSPLFIAVLGLSSFFALLGTAMAAKILTGHETLIYYRDVIPIFVLAAAISWLLHQPVLKYLDVTILGAGIFLACGRIGCLLVGCCHGRPCRWGVRYSEEHAEAGFPSWLVGVRLFPIQMAESVGVLGIVIVAAARHWQGSAPGDILSLYVMTYAAGRFVIEFFRGDADRPYLAGFSEAQWTSLVLIFAVLIAERFGALSAQAWHALLLPVMASAMTVIAFVGSKHKSSRRLSFSPGHICELARATQSTAGAGGSRVRHTPPTPHVEPIRLARTSQGLQISRGVIHRSRQTITHFSVSRAASPLTATDATKLARIFACFPNSPGHCRILPGNGGVFHMLFIREAVGATPKPPCDKY